MRKTEFKNGEYYHIYNRGVDKRKIFLDKDDYFRFVKSFKEFNREDSIISLFLQNKLKKTLVESRSLPRKKLVKVVSICLLPNHFHLILKQLEDKGISDFMQKVGCGYVGFFNHKYKRSGVLFQGRFKAIHIDSNEYLMYLSAYVNGNHKVHNIETNKKISSFDLVDNKIVNMDIILSDFKNIKDYKKYVSLISSDIGKRREEMKKYLIE